MAINKCIKTRKTWDLSPYIHELWHRQTPLQDELWRNNIPTPWNIHIAYARNAHKRVYTQKEHWLLRPLENFGEFTSSGLKQNAFLRQWISPHQHRKYIHFFTINAHLEYYFFLYKEFTLLSDGRKKEDEKSSSPKTSHKTLSSVA